MFAAFALPTELLTQGEQPPSQPAPPLAEDLPPPSQPAPPPLEGDLPEAAPPPPQAFLHFRARKAQPTSDPERDAWAASIYQQLAASSLHSSSLDQRLPTVPVILHPSVRRGGAAQPITARHLGFLRVDLTGESAGPGRFFPLFPADAAEREAGVDTGSLDRFGCTGHWASSGCIRLLTAGGCSSGGGSSGGSSSSSGLDAISGSQAGGLALIPPDAFAALWASSSSGSSSSHSRLLLAPGSSTSGGSSSTDSGLTAAASLPCSSGDGSAGDAPTTAASWHVTYSRLLPLEEAYGGLYRELKAAGADLSRAHYMLRGWKTREGRPRLGGSSAPRDAAAASAAAASMTPLARPVSGGGSAAARPRRGVVPAELAATRHLRAMINWPGLLSTLEEEGVESVPTDGVRYWLARLGAAFQARLATAGVLCADSTVHHIIARSNRGIDHPLNYFLVDRGPNSAMGSKVEGFRDAAGVKLHMRDVVGEQAFEVAHAACNLYHGVLYAGRQRGERVESSLRQLREGAFALAEEAMEARRVREARQQARAAAAAATAQADAAAAAGDGRAARLDPEQQQQQVRQQEQPEGGSLPPRSLKRERCPSQQQQQQAKQQLHDEWGEEENAPSPHNGVTSPRQQQQQQRRRRLSGELCLAPAAGPLLVPPVAAVGAVVNRIEEAAGVQRLLAGLPPGCSPPQESRQVEQQRLLAPQQIQAQQEQQRDQQQEVQTGQQQQQGQQQQPKSRPAADLCGLRARLRAALGVAGSTSSR